MSPEVIVALIFGTLGLLSTIVFALHFLFTRLTRMELKVDTLWQLFMYHILSRHHHHRGSMPPPPEVPPPSPGREPADDA